jgi:hypothetical protein
VPKDSENEGRPSKKSASKKPSTRKDASKKAEKKRRPKKSEHGPPNAEGPPARKPGRRKKSAEAGGVNDTSRTSDTNLGKTWWAKFKSLPGSIKSKAAEVEFRESLGRIRCKLWLHSYGAWSEPSTTDCSQSRTCQRCGKVKQRISHDWSEPLYSQPHSCQLCRVCRRCRVIDTNVGVGHQWLEWTKSTSALALGNWAVLVNNSVARREADSCACREAAGGLLRPLIRRTSAGSTKSSTVYHSR